MSVDTTLLIIGTKGKNGSMEYRTASVQAAENLDYSMPEGKPNLACAYYWFKNKPVCHERETALRDAQALYDTWGPEDKYWFAEEGIVLREYPEVEFPPEEPA